MNKLQGNLPLLAAESLLCSSLEKTASNNTVQLNVSEETVSPGKPSKLEQQNDGRKNASAGGRKKQEGCQECFICLRPQVNLRQHLAKVHHLDEIPRSFILSYYRTKISKDPVYQCNTCLIRFCSRRLRVVHANHNLLRVNDRASVEEFPEEIKTIY